MKFIVVSGRSGSGKTITLRVLEDLGFYCIDNMLLSLLPSMTRELLQKHSRVAISIDARNLGSQAEQLAEFLAHVQMTPIRWEILYLDADDSILLKRFSETRRKHPLTDAHTTLQEAIVRERLLLEPLANSADLMIDTSQMTQQQLTQILRNRVAEREIGTLSLLFQSFGYKRGIPADSDFVFDARCLPNPYWIPELRPLTGRDQPVIDFFATNSQVKQMVDQIEQYLSRWIPQFEADNRSYLTVAVGCTGGHHRSVYVCEKLCESFQKQRDHVQVRHRELPL
jgi:UPF0042 nucleotide-binding protein